MTLKQKFNEIIKSGFFEDVDDSSLGINEVAIYMKNNPDLVAKAEEFMTKKLNLKYHKSITCDKSAVDFTIHGSENGFSADEVETLAFEIIRKNKA